MRNDDATSLSRTLANTLTLQLAQIHAVDAFCTPIEERFERLTRLGQRALGVPVIAITSITNDVQWFKSVRGWNIVQLPLQESLCQRVVESGKAVAVGDLAQNPRYAKHPRVVGQPAFRLYCGFPLRNAKRDVIGTLCAMSQRPRRVTNADLQILADLAILAEREFLTVELQDAQSVLISKLSVARRQALLDPLTCTWNRRGGEMLIEEALKQAKKKRKNVAVLAVDLDDFKQVNDTFGHAVGDNALRTVARELLSCVREGDGVCRFGGDEFFVVLSDVPREGVERIASRLRRRVQESQIAVGPGRKARLSISVGIAFTEDPGAATATELLSEADESLYRQKMERHLRVEAV